MSIHLLLLRIPLPPRSTLFPYTTLFRSDFFGFAMGTTGQLADFPSVKEYMSQVADESDRVTYDVVDTTTMGNEYPLDRKSTRLNSSHVAISYAVFCLKKKTRGSPNTDVR